MRECEYCPRSPRLTFGAVLESALSALEICIAECLLVSDKAKSTTTKLTPGLCSVHCNYSIFGVDYSIVHFHVTAC